MLQVVAKPLQQLAHEWPVLGQVKQQVPACLQAHLALAWALALAALQEEEMVEWVAPPRSPQWPPGIAPAVWLQRQQAGEWLPAAMEEQVEGSRQLSRCWPMLLPGLPVLQH